MGHCLRRYRLRLLLEWQVRSTELVAWNLKSLESKTVNIARKDHPIWKLATIALIGTFFIAFMVLSPTTFDGPDIERLIAGLVTAAGYGELRAKLGSKGE